jgi:hypothetical protein
LQLFLLTPSRIKGTIKRSEKHCLISFRCPLRKET